jgi:prophage regulatory protein
MTRADILERLRIDPGQQTLGQLLQDREAAAYEIGWLRAEIERIRARRSVQAPKSVPAPDTAESRPSYRAGSLLRLADVRELLGISRSTVYKLLSVGRFPKPIRLGPRIVRWRLEAIESWRDRRE